MCWNCSDCEVISNPGEPVTLKCIGFKNQKPLVVVYGNFTEYYRWCSNWTMEQIDAEEKRLIEMQRRKK